VFNLGLQPVIHSSGSTLDTDSLDCPCQGRDEIPAQIKDFVLESST